MAGVTTFDGDDFVIEVPYHVNTRTRLHELGHKYYGHKPEEMSGDDYFDQEFLAEKYAYEKMNKEINIYTVYVAMISLVYIIRDEHYASWLFNKALKTLKEYGFSQDKIYRSFLWQNIMKDFDYCKSKDNI